MIVEIQIQDSIFKKYQEYNTADPYKALSRQIQRFADVNPADRVIIIDAENRRKLEALLNETTTDAASLVEKVKSLLTIKVDDIKVALTPETVETLKSQAEFEGMDQKEYTEQKIREGIEVAVMGFVS